MGVGIGSRLDTLSSSLGGIESYGLDSYPVETILRATGGASFGALTGDDNYVAYPTAPYCILLRVNSPCCTLLHPTAYDQQITTHPLIKFFACVMYYLSLPLVQMTDLSDLYGTHTQPSIGSTSFMGGGVTGGGVTGGRTRGSTPSSSYSPPGHGKSK